MKHHQSYNTALPPEELDDGQRDEIIDIVGGIFDGQPEIDIVETESGELELVVPNRLRPTDKIRVCNHIEDRVSDALASGETILLTERETWPNSKYEICIATD